MRGLGGTCAPCVPHVSPTSPPSVPPAALSVGPGRGDRGMSSRVPRPAAGPQRRAAGAGLTPRWQLLLGVAGEACCWRPGRPVSRSRTARRSCSWGCLATSPGSCGYLPPAYGWCARRADRPDDAWASEEEGCGEPTSCYGSAQTSGIDQLGRATAPGSAADSCSFDHPAVGTGIDIDLAEPKGGGYVVRISGIDAGGASVLVFDPAAGAGVAVVSPSRRSLLSAASTCGE